MISVYEYFQKMQEEQVLLYFKGDITNNLLTSLLQLIDDRLERKSEDIKIKRKVFSILLECLQNIYNYQQFNQFDNEELQSATLMVRRTEEAYYIVTGNYIKAEKVEILENKILKINALSSDELKGYYKEIISNNERSEAGGAGLGLIDMARKSGEKIEYSFEKADEINYFYILQIKVTI